MIAPALSILWSRINPDQATLLIRGLYPERFDVFHKVRTDALKCHALRADSVLELSVCDGDVLVVIAYSEHHDVIASAVFEIRLNLAHAIGEILSTDRLIIDQCDASVHSGIQTAMERVFGSQEVEAA